MSLHVKQLRPGSSSGTKPVRWSMAPDDPALLLTRLVVHTISQILRRSGLHPGVLEGPLGALEQSLESWLQHQAVHTLYVGKLGSGPVGIDDLHEVRFLYGQPPPEVPLDTLRVQPAKSDRSLTQMTLWIERVAYVQVLISAVAAFETQWWTPGYVESDSEGWLNELVESWQVEGLGARLICRKRTKRVAQPYFRPKTYRPPPLAKTSPPT